ncbi:polysaccharide biosynthesis C-terminal domain-containing protein [Ligilactobacillus ruminis]|uniref:polysaccharide biosynthesis C-terminal domain-containing protein n=1 Tax=Ligilactobacillus ruminis TaxID=1623 RepID=UPI001F4E2EE1|nr:polysaccharide biosynthesis C-terminal domain-containing protein [Ligilactobacillus ruminis]
MTAAEDTKKSFYLMLTTTVINLIFNLLFIVGLKLGVAGSAMGTILAQLIGALLTLKLLEDKFHFAKYSGRIFNAKQIKNVLHIALPATFQQFVVTFGGVFIQSLVNPFGREVIIGYVAILRIMNFFRIVWVGLAQTLTVYGAQLISARQFSGFKKSIANSASRSS